MGKLPTRTYRKLYLQEWLEVTGHEQGGAAASAGVDASYISNLVAGRKPNPSAHVLLAISEYLGVTVNDLYRRPPPESSLTALSELSPGARSILIDRTKRR